jgi:stage IV sporulation protein B
MIDTTDIWVIPCGNLIAFKTFTKEESGYGIGTMTYYNPKSKNFGAIAHSITTEIGKFVYTPEIDYIDKAASIIVGKKEFKDLVGSVISKSEYGVYGKLYDSMSDKPKVPVANRNEIKIGKATLICTVDGATPREYEIEIFDINYSPNTIKNLSIKIVDPKLIEISGGILMGMSGSPIIQNGKLVGALNFMLAFKPLYGYALFADIMLTQ